MTTAGILSVSGTGVSSINGNLNMNSKYVVSVSDPVNAQDVATKNYVDGLVSTGLLYHAAVNVATTTTLAVATSGTTAYNSPNGAGNGIGAYISTTGTFTAIDGVSIASAGARILVKNEANATWNGVYTYTNASAITRSTDTDTYGTGSGDLSENDYFFVQAGTVNIGTSYVCNVAGTITFGTTNITFAQFSTSQVYTGSTGITITGTAISANASQTQVTAVGTLTSLSVSGNANVGNLGTAGLITATGNITGGNISGTLLTGTLATAVQPNVTSLGTLTSLGVNGTITASAITANTGVFTGNANGLSSLQGTNVVGTLNSTTLGNSTVYIGTTAIALNRGSASQSLTGITSIDGYAATVSTAAQPNITSTGTLTTVSVSGNANVGNLYTGGLVSATGNVTGGNLTTGGLVTATGNLNAGNIITAGIMSSTGNATHGNIITSGVVTATGNVTGGNIVTGGVVTATGNITGANVIASSYHIRSVNASVSAAGTVQSNATILTTEFNRVSTVASGSGVVLPSAIAGMAITIVNTSANSLLVYPASGAQINALSANVGFTQPTLGTIQYVALTTTQWYTVGGTYA